MSDERKRIYELDSAETIASNDSMVIDNPNREEAVKIPVNSFKTMLTKAEYDALPSSKNTDGIIYYITDNNKIMLNGNSYGGVDVNAEAVSYDNTASGLEADNVQDAIDEVLETAGKVDDVKVDGESVVDENKVANIDLSALKIVRDIPNTPTAIATFTDGSDLPMPKLEVGIEPIQDLHGYDAPWVGGSGKNKLPLTEAEMKRRNTSGAWNNNAYTLNGLTFTIKTDESNNIIGINVNGTASDDTTFTVYDGTLNLGADGSYTMSGCPLNGSTSTYRLSVFRPNSGSANDVGNGIAYSYDEPIRHYVFITIISGTTLNNLLFQPMIESGNTKTTFAPYSNICPISGWDEVDVTRCGKNLFDESILLECNGWTVSDGVYSGDSPQINVKYGSGVPNLAFKSNTQYTFSFTYGQDGSAGIGLVIAIRYTDDTVTQKYCTLDTIGFVSVTSTAGKNIKRLQLSYGVDRTIHLSNMQLEEGSTATTYEPYNGQTYTIDLDGTRYGGKVDLVSGVMTVTHKSLNLGDQTWGIADSSGGVNRFYAELNDMKSMTIRSMNILCSCYKTNVGGGVFDDSTIYNTPTPTRIMINTSQYSDATALKNSLSGQVALYELATPLTIQLPTTVVKSLRGVNNISADCGDVIDGKYIADASSTIASFDARITALENQ